MSDTPNPETPETPEDFKALYEAEAAKTADLIQQRNLLRPAQRMLNGLTAEQRDSLIAAGEMAGANDMKGLQDWLESSLEGISGKSVAELVAERQRIAQQSPEEAAKPAPGLTAEQVQEIVARQTAIARDAERGEQRVREEMSTAGYKLDSAAGQTIINYAVAHDVGVKEATEWYENDVTTSVLEKQKAAAAAAAQVPGVAPSGSAAGVVPERKEGESGEDFRRRSITARLKAGVTN